MKIKSYFVSGSLWVKQSKNCVPESSISEPCALWYCGIPLPMWEWGALLRWQAEVMLYLKTAQKGEAHRNLKVACCSWSSLLLEPQEIVPQGRLLRPYKEQYSWNDRTVDWVQSPPVSTARMRTHTHKADEKAPNEEQILCDSWQVCFCMWSGKTCGMHTHGSMLSGFLILNRILRYFQPTWDSKQSELVLITGRWCDQKQNGDLIAERTAKWVK